MKYIKEPLNMQCGDLGEGGDCLDPAAHWPCIHPAARLWRARSVTANQTSWWCRQAGARLSGREGDTGHLPSSFGQVLSLWPSKLDKVISDTLQQATGTSYAATLLIVLWIGHCSCSIDSGPYPASGESSWCPGTLLLPHSRQTLLYTAKF